MIIIHFVHNCYSSIIIHLYPFLSPLTPWLGALRQGLRQGGRREAVGAGGHGMTFPRGTGSSPPPLLVR